MYLASGKNLTTGGESHLIAMTRADLEVMIQRLDEDGVVEANMPFQGGAVEVRLIVAENKAALERKVQQTVAHLPPSTRPNTN